MKKLYYIKIENWNEIISESYEMLDNNDLRTNKKQYKEKFKDDYKRLRITFENIENIFYDKKLFLIVVDLYLKKMKSKWFTNYFGKEILWELLEWYNDYTVNYIANNYYSYIENVPEKVFNNFINKDLFFSIIKSSIDEGIKLKILQYYKEVYDNLMKIKKDITTTLIVNSWIVALAVYAFLNAKYKIIPAMAKFLSQWGWTLSPLVVTIQHIWLPVMIASLSFLSFFIWMFFYNWDTFFKFFRFIKPQYRLYQTVNTLKLFLISLLVNSLSPEKFKQIIKETFNISVNWKNYKEMLKTIKNNPEYKNLFRKDYLIWLISADTWHIQSYIWNLTEQITNLNEELEQDVSLFKNIIKKLIFFIIVIIVMLVLLNFVWIMKSMMGTISSSL